MGDAELGFLLWEACSGVGVVGLPGGVGFMALPQRRADRSAEGGGGAAFGGGLGATPQGPGDDGQAL
ncbi:hypothetical protein GCM10010300_46260 [Streptomyces olivaceoviridis]|nr:hypothetical protein GCM10010300_46260 [Streptomyces olivaceoviridis]